MTEEEKYIKCKNCKQDILESKMFLHEGFCLRNNKLCPECDKVFLVQEYEEHLKTHNSQKPPEKKSAISEHRKNCHHNEKPKNNLISPNPKPQIPKKEKIIVDDNLGLKQCEYCTNMFEDLPKHLKECEIKKMIEAENSKYYSDLEKRKKEDDALAQKLSKEKIMDISKDEQMAKELEKNMKPIIDINKDEEMALKLQDQFQKEFIDVKKDEELARKLENEFTNKNIIISEDEKLAKELQNQFSKEYTNNIQSDEEYARRLQQQEGMNNNNQNNNMGQYPYGFNNPNNFNNEDLYQ